MKNPKWKRNLTAKELRHLKEMEVTSLASFKRTRELQLELKASTPNASEPCWECHFMAKKLGW